MVSALVIGRTERLQQTRWTEGNSFSVLSSLLDADFQDEVQLLDRNKYTSVTTALVALNKNIVDPANFYFVFSERRQALYLLWPSETTEQKTVELITRLNVSELKKIAKGVSTRLEETSYDLKKYNTDLSEVHRESSSISEASTVDTSPEQKNVRVPSPERMVLERNIDAPIFETSLDRTRVRRVSPDRRLAGMLSSPRDNAVDTAPKRTKAKILERVSSNVMCSPRTIGDDISTKRTKANIVDHVSTTVMSSPRTIGDDVSTKRTRANCVSPERLLARSLTSPCISFDETSLERVKDELASEPMKAKVISPSYTSSVTNLTSPRRIASQSTAFVKASFSQAVSSANKPSIDVMRASLTQQPGKASSRFQNGKHVDETFGMKEVTLVALAGTGTNTTMTIEDLHMEQIDFDPNRPQMKAQILNKLGLPTSAAIDRLEDNAGSFNDGVWIVSDSASTGFVLKLVPHHRVRVGRKTDTEKYIELQTQCPRIASYLSFTFPVKIFQLRDPSGNRCKDLLVMRQAPGLQITQHLYCKFHGGQTAELLTMCEKFGRCLQEIHRVYIGGSKSMQHGDCQPSNVFYDEASGSFTLVDVADFGFGPFLAQGGEDDVEHFVGGLCSLKTWYGQSLMDACGQKFRKGYNEGFNRQ